MEKAVKWNARKHASAVRVLSTRLFLVFMVVCDWNISSIELQILPMFQAIQSYEKEMNRKQ